MDELRIFLTHPDPSDPAWWAAIAAGLVAAAVLYDAARPHIAAIVAGTSTKLDDRVLAVVDKVAGCLRLVARGIRFLLPLAFYERFGRPSSGGVNAQPYEGDPYADNSRKPEDDRGEAAL